MSNSKKSDKTAKLPQPIKIKKEKLEEDRVLHSMGHFVDDRVELVKQIFGSLKTKTITNLAPEYLKEKSMEEIQELCLNELLCISKKRLMAVINATKCPSDTETSDDSDIEAKDEHISLEEISSESDLENREKTSRRGTSQTRPKKVPKKPNQTNTKNGNDGQMSVLELLELQARARAIRSQLALEPVTKIEVDLDDNKATPSETVSSTTKEKNSNRKHKKANGKELDSVSLPISVSGSGSTVTSPSTSVTQEFRNRITTLDDGCNRSSDMIPSTNSKQKIKLKRNFRKHTEDIEETIISEKEIQNNTEKLKQEKRSHSPSPDVVPIEPVPETFCISDSGSESELKLKSIQSIQETKEKKTIEDKKEEAEDGEIIESEDSNLKESIDTSLDSNKSLALPIEIGITKSENPDIILNDEGLVKPVETEKIEDEQKIIEIQSSTEADEQIKIKKEEDPKNIDNTLNVSNANVDIDSDGDQNDDIISIEGGDLETEMSEHLELTTKKFGYARKDLDYDDDNDVISLGSTDDENERTGEDIVESWHARYLKSSKVNKVLAVSRLGKRVRDKLKTSKHSKQETTIENTKEGESDGFKSKHEEGSVEQYKELLEISHRKP